MIEDDAIEKGHNGVSEPGVQYGTMSGHHEGLLGEQHGSVPPPRVVTDEENGEMLYPRGISQEYG